jgi:hypothetical protein
MRLHARRRNVRRAFRSIGHAVPIAAVVWLAGCSDPEKDRVKATTKPTYDKATGKLRELTYDANKNGRIDTWTEMDGSRPIASRIDRNEDGRIDRWEYYDGSRGLLKVGFSRRDDGKPDAWVFSGAGGKVERVEISSSGDEKKIDRWEHYDGSGGGPDGNGVLVRAEEDTNGDGRPDKWGTYENGALKTASFDETGDGKPDRRLTYNGSALVLIESAPDNSGAFTKRVEPK